MSTSTSPSTLTKSASSTTSICTSTYPPSRTATSSTETQQALVNLTQDLFNERERSNQRPHQNSDKKHAPAPTAPATPLSTSPSTSLPAPELFDDAKVSAYFPILHRTLASPRFRWITVDDALTALSNVLDLPLHISNYVAYLQQQSTAYSSNTFHLAPRDDAIHRSQDVVLKNSYLMMGSLLCQEKYVVCYNNHPRPAPMVVTSSTSINSNNSTTALPVTSSTPAALTSTTDARAPYAYVEKLYCPFVIRWDASVNLYRYQQSHDVQWHRLRLNPAQKVLLHRLVLNIVQVTGDYLKEHATQSRLGQPVPLPQQQAEVPPLLRYLTYNYNAYKHGYFADRSKHSISAIISNMVLVTIFKNCTDVQVRTLMSTWFPQWNGMHRVQTHIWVLVAHKKQRRPYRLGESYWKCVEVALPVTWKDRITGWIHEFDNDDVLL